MAHAYQDYSIGQTVTARVLDVRPDDLVMVVDGEVPARLPVARPVNFGADPVRYFLPGDEVALTVAELDHTQQGLVLALDADYAARLAVADLDQIAVETRHAILLMSQQRALALPDDNNDSDGDDLFADFDSRLAVHGTHSKPIMLEEDFDNFADTLYQQIDAKLHGDDFEDDEDDDED